MKFFYHFAHKTKSRRLPTCTILVKNKIFTQYHDTMSKSMIYNVKISSYGAKLSSYSDKHHQIMKHEHIKTNYRMLCYVNVPSNEEPSV